MAPPPNVPTQAVTRDMKFTDTLGAISKKHIRETQGQQVEMTCTCLISILTCQDVRLDTEVHFIGT